MDEVIKQLLKELQDRTILQKNWEDTSHKLIRCMDIMKRIESRYPHIWRECVTWEEIKEIFGLK